MAQIVSITYQPINQPYGEERYDSFIRVPFQEAKLVAGHGIEGDQKAGRNPRRQINLLGFEWLEALRQQGYKTEPGAFGEQLIVQGLDVQALQPGEQLQLGDEAVIEITRPRTGCIRLETAQGRSTKEVDGPVGMLATVIRSGTIRVGEAVRVLSHADA
jgi:molybdopterin adenylyltransferase